MAAWVHGGWLVRGQPIEVREVFTVRKGHPKTSMGFEARICFAPAIEVRTTKYHPTEQDAENAIRDAFRAWCNDDDEAP